MAIFNISFRIKETGEHQKRYESVVAAIKKEAKDNTTWEETTSFVVLESNKSAADLCNTIYYGSDFMTDWDKIVVVDLSTKAHASQGKFDYPNMLSSLMSKR
jgi:hypothetical protein